MKRVHAPEIEDESWCPAVLRDGLTGFLRIAAETLGVYDPATPVIAALLERHQGRHLVDLCSGGGGPILRLRRSLASHHHLDVTATLTDLYPNLDAFAAAEARGIVDGEARVHGHRVPVDAANVPPELNGIRTLVNGLHHFRPADARRLVADAAAKEQPFVCVEVVERRPGTVLMVLGTPLATLLLMPFQRPNIWQLLMTYVVPIIPLAVLWDGLMSCLRAYDIDELEELTAGLETERYSFRVERHPVRFLPARLTILIGEPAPSAGAPSTLP